MAFLLDKGCVVISDMDTSNVGISSDLSLDINMTWISLSGDIVTLKSLNFIKSIVVVLLVIIYVL